MAESKPNVAVQRMLPIGYGSDVGATHVVNGRSFTSVPGTIVDVAAQDDAVLVANKWFRVGGKDCKGVGTTAQRPTDGLYHGACYVDTTLGYIVVHDGASWRNPVTGAAV